VPNKNGYLVGSEAVY